MPRASTAARLAAVPRDRYGRPLQVARSSGTPYAGDAGGGPIGLTVELYLGALGWTDISAFVLYRDSSQLITITRGRPNETSSVQPQTATFQVNNRDGRFSPRNPDGAYYGYIGRNTPVRISRMQNGIRRYRFVGEVPAWPTTWDISGTDVWADVTAAGQLRRLQQGTTPLQSVLRRNVPLQPNLAVYWPCEDQASATQLTAAIGGTPMSVNGKLNAASFSGLVASNPIPTLGTDSWYGVIPGGTTGTSGLAGLFIAVPTSNSLADASRIASIATTGTISRIDLLYRTGEGFTLRAYDNLGALALDSGVVSATVSGQIIRLSVYWQPSGGGSQLEWDILTVTNSFAATRVIAGTNVLSQQITGAVNIRVAPDGNMSGMAAGQIWVAGTNTELQGQSIGGFNEGIFYWANAYNLENPVWRFARLCYESNIPYAIANPLHATDYGIVAMGPQTVDTFGNSVQACVDTDLSLLYEARDQLALILRTRVSLLNQSAGIVLDFAQHQLAGPLNPLDDDAYTRNDITVQQVSGSSAEAALSTGALSTQEPPNGVGGYATTYSLNVGNFSQSLADHAHWRLRMGTVDEPRYPHISLNLRHPQFTGNLDLLNAALTIDIGDVAEIDNPPAWMPPDAIRQIIQGYSETMGVWEHNMVLNCSPEAPYRVGVVGDPVLGVADTDGSTLAAPLGPVLNSNPFFAGGSLGPNALSGCTAQIVGTSGSSKPLPAGGPTGYGLLLTPTGSGSAFATTEFFPVSPGLTYFGSVLAYSPAGYNGVFVHVNFYDATQVFISGSSSSFNVAAGSWGAYSDSLVAPANAAFAQIHAGESGAPTSSNTLYLAALCGWAGGVAVASTNPLLPLWTTSAGAFPFDIAVSPLGSGGERMTVTGISGAASPQTFTVARGVGGVAPAQPAGADVRLWQASYVSL